jgi:phosphocarrier protein
MSPGDSVQPSAVHPDAPAPGEARSVVTVRNKLGLHARAAARFVKLASQFNAAITVSKDGTTVSGLSIMGLMMFAAGLGSPLEIRATGADAERAVEALVALVSGKFDED